MAIIKIKGQTVHVNGKVLSIRIREPFWSAWQKFGWTEGVPGFGIGSDIIEYAHENKKTIQVVYKDDTYKISRNKIVNIIDTYYSYFTTQNGVRLLVIPKSEFTRISHDPSIQAVSPLLAMSQEQRDKLREKLFGSTSKKGGFV